MFEDKLPPISAFDVVDAATSPSITINVEARIVQLADNLNITPSTINTWRYVRKESGEDGVGVLKVNLGPIINVSRGETLSVHWVNKLGSMPPMMAGNGATLEMPPINSVPMDVNIFRNEQWEKMNPSVGIVTHLHGAKVEARSDGWPLTPASFASNPYSFPADLHYTYKNDQRAAMLWFHDHAMDNTSIQVHAGLAGVYFVRDDSDNHLDNLIGNKGNSELPLVIQDRIVDCGFDQINYWAGIPTTTTPATSTDARKQNFIRSEYLGETIFVNGRPWPFMKAKRKVYRLRLLNGSNARTYSLALINPAGWAKMNAPDQPVVWHSDLLTVIGNDGGLLAKSVRLDATDYILLAPGERLDVLLDLTAVDPMVTPQLRLVNLAVASIRNGDAPEAIFQTQEDLIFPTTTPIPVDLEYPATAQPVLPILSSILSPLPTSAFDRTLLSVISGISQANIMQFCIDDSTPPAPALNTSALDAILHGKATEDGFTWDGTKLGKEPAGSNIAANRFVVLMNNTVGVPYDTTNTLNPYAKGPWRDTQVWEMTTVAPALGSTAFKIPIEIDLTSVNPTPGISGGAQKDYYVKRSAFFKTYPAAKRIDEKPYGYDQLNTNVIQPKVGTYERWYVANIGNEQPIKAGSGGDGATPPTVPDMHPFHMHLVNFVVTRRWRLNPATNVFDETTNGRRLDFDGISRHDIVRVQSNELLELLVYFPPGYTGKYPFHCHIVEHEDMGMMSHFEVV